MFTLLSFAVGALVGSVDDFFDLATTETILEELHETSVDTEHTTSPDPGSKRPVLERDDASRRCRTSEGRFIAHKPPDLRSFDHGSYGDASSDAPIDTQAMLELGEILDDDATESFADPLRVSNVEGRLSLTEVHPTSSSLPMLESVSPQLHHGDLMLDYDFPIKTQPTREYYQAFSTDKGELQHVFGHLAYYNTEGRNPACLEYPHTAGPVVITAGGETTLRTSLIRPVKSLKDILRESGHPIHGDSIIFDDLKSLVGETVAPVTPVLHEANVGPKFKHSEYVNYGSKNIGGGEKRTKKLPKLKSSKRSVGKHVSTDGLSGAHPVLTTAASSLCRPYQDVPKDQSVDKTSYSSTAMSAEGKSPVSGTTTWLSWLAGTSTLTTDMSSYDSATSSISSLGPSELVQEDGISDGRGALSLLGPSILSEKEKPPYLDWLLTSPNLTFTDSDSIRSFSVLGPSVLIDTEQKEDVSILGPSVLAAQGEGSLTPSQSATLQSVTGSQHQGPYCNHIETQSDSIHVERINPLLDVLGWFRSRSLVRHCEAPDDDTIDSQRTSPLAQASHDAAQPGTGFVTFTAEEGLKTITVEQLTNATPDGDSLQDTLRLGDHAAQCQASEEIVAVGDMREMATTSTSSSSSAPIEPPSQPVAKPPVLTKSQRKARNRRARQALALATQLSQPTSSVPQPANPTKLAAQASRLESSKSNTGKTRVAKAKSTAQADGQAKKPAIPVIKRHTRHVPEHDISNKVMTLASVLNQAPLPFKIHIHSTIEAYSYASMVYAPPQGPLAQEFGSHHLVMWTDGTNPPYSKRLQAFAVVYRTEPLILGQERSGWHEWAFTGHVQSNAVIMTLETMAVQNALAVAVKEVSRRLEKPNEQADHIRKVTIFTDSQPTLTGLLTGKLGSLGASIVKYADMLVAQGITVDLRWVPSHAAVPGNEAADRLALLASQFGPLPQKDAFLRIPVPLLRFCERQFATAEVWSRGQNQAVVKPFLEMQRRELREALGQAGVEEGWGDLLV
ncbi:hypothetical protein DL546_008551 [Coniochaeta pulveracea]|uniref:RNase H type-1 domain-containing protein n=1 Tax=Coniochaeta pulveracea TaxID=177199 RepID=A0A420YLC1_9PEZI|nr:hypothetical protein DL546_008551 [Coniochaeta pulveracea]